MSFPTAMDHATLSFLAVVATIAWTASVFILRVQFQWHHFWIGVPLVIWPGAPFWVRIIGLLIMIDDAIQHAVQVTAPAYRSPLHRAYAWVLRLLEGLR